MDNTTIENQDVSAAFELLGESFAEALDQISKKLSAALKKEWENILTLRENLSPAAQEIVADAGEKLFPSKSRKTGYTRKVEGPIGERTGLRVNFPDGTEITGKTAKDVFVETIEKVGGKRVSDLNILTGGENLVSLTGSEKKHQNPTKIFGGYYVLTCSPTEQKKKWLEYISEKLKLGLKVKIVPHHSR